MAETSADVIKRYLEDAIAAQKSLENQLSLFAVEADSADVKQLFQEHASETRSQHERLTERLKALGGYQSGGISLLASIFGSITKTAHRAPPSLERTIQNLITAFAAENGEVAMYEALAVMSEAAGDSQTGDLARSIQHEQKRAAESFWQVLPFSASRP